MLKDNVILFTLLLFPSLAFAGTEEYFAKDYPKNLFSDDIYTEGSGGVRLIKVKPKVVPLEEEKISSAAEKTEAAASTSQPAEKKSLEDTLLHKYGNPDEPYEVRAHDDNTPGPKKAAIEALANGDEELAYKYMRQYVRYEKERNKVLDKMVGLQGKAAVKEGQLPPDSWANGDGYTDLNYLLNRDEDNEKSETYNLDAALQREFERAEKSDEIAAGEFGKFLGSHFSSSESAEADRARARSKYSAVLRPSGTEKIEMILLFETTDYRAQLMAAQLEKLRQSFAEKGLSLKAYTLFEESQKAIAKFKADTKISCDIKNGSNLAKKLGLAGEPVLLIRSEASPKLYAEKGFRSLAFLEGIVE